MIADALSTMLPARRSAMPSPDDDFWYYPVGRVSEAGVTVTPDNTLGVSAAYGCIRVLRESLSQLPWKIYRRTGERSKELAQDHQLWKVLHDRPNSWQTPMEFLDMAVNYLCLRGNFYCLISQPYGMDGENIELWPLCPDRIEVKQYPDKTIQYLYRELNKEPIVYRSEEMFHVRGMSLNGITGCSVIEYARNALGASMAQEQHGSSLFKNGGLPTFWISRPREARWTPVARKNFREEWKAIHAGADNAGQPPILSDGMELHELGMTNRDSQWIEARGFQAEEICRFFGVSPHMIGVKSSAPLGSIEQQSLEFVLYTLGPLAVRFEQAANRDLLDPDEEGEYFTKIILDALLRGDLQSRYEAHNISVQGGWGLVNEVRELEDRNPIEGGDVPRFPMNMQPAGGGPDEDQQGGQPGKGQPVQRQEEEMVEEEATTARRNGRTAETEQAFRILLQEAAERIAMAEITGLSLRASKAHENIEKWHDYTVSFYHKHQRFIEMVIRPICLAWLCQTSNKIDPRSVSESLVCDTKEIYDSSLDQLDVLNTWRNNRSERLFDILKTEFEI